MMLFANLTFVSNINLFRSIDTVNAVRRPCKIILWMDLSMIGGHFPLVLGLASIKWNEDNFRNMVSMKNEQSSKFRCRNYDEHDSQICDSF